MIPTVVQPPEAPKRKGFRVLSKKEMAGFYVNRCHPSVIQEYEPYKLTERLLKRLKWLHETTGRLFTIEELAQANIDRSLNARQRIAIAVAQLEAEGSEIDVRKVARRAKSCNKTVSKHSDLLDRRGGEYIAGGQGGLLSLLDCSGGSLAAFSSCSEKEVSVSDPVPSEEGSIDLVEAGSQDFPVDPPLLHAWQESQPENPQSQAQALRVPTASLTPGPRVSGIEALPPETAGGLSLMPAVLDLGGFGDVALYHGVLQGPGDASVGFLALVRGPVRPMPGQAPQRRSRVVGRGPP